MKIDHPDVIMIRASARLGWMRLLLPEQLRDGVPTCYTVHPPKQYDGDREVAYSIDSAIEKAQRMARKHKRATGETLDIRPDTVHPSDAHRFVYDGKRGLTAS